MKSPAAAPRLTWLALFAVLTAGFGPVQGLAEPARFELDPEHLTIAFLVEHIGYAKTLGVFRKATGHFSLDEKSGELSDVRIVVDSASVDTAHAARDEHLRKADFLDVRRFPAMVFTAKSARRSGERSYLIDGELELLGRKRPLRLEATLNKLDRYPIGPPLLKPFVAGASARGRFKRSEFGMNYGVVDGLVGDEVELIIELEAQRK